MPCCVVHWLRCSTDCDSYKRPLPPSLELLSTRWVATMTCCVAHCLHCSTDCDSCKRQLPPSLRLLWEAPWQRVQVVPIPTEYDTQIQTSLTLTIKKHNHSESIYILVKLLSCSLTLNRRMNESINQSINHQIARQHTIVLEWTITTIMSLTALEVWVYI